MVIKDLGSLVLGILILVISLGYIVEGIIRDKEFNFIAVLGILFGCACLSDAVTTV